MSESPSFAGYEGTSGLQTSQGTPIGEAQGDHSTDGYDMSPTTPQEAMDAAFMSNYYALADRLAANPTPTQQELEIGVFVEEIQPQARDAILGLRQKGYDIGSVLSAGFVWGNESQQQTDFSTKLGDAERAVLAENGFNVEEHRISFYPQNPSDLETIKPTWDWLAALLPDLGTPAGPGTYHHAVAFREAADAGTLLSAYMQNGRLNMAGVKAVAPAESAQPEALWDLKQSLSPDPVAATRELALVDIYHDLKNRIATNPTPTLEEWNAGAYKEELEPQVRDAIMLMRQKGYGTTSSGFYGEGAAGQVVDLDTYLDPATKTSLIELGITATDKQIRFTPDNPTDLQGIKETWDMIAGLLPHRGSPAEPSRTLGADLFRYAVQHNLHEDHLEVWLLDTGALDGYMPPLVVTLLNEGRDFGSDVYAASQNAQARFDAMLAAVKRAQK